MVEKFILHYIDFIREKLYYTLQHHIPEDKPSLVRAKNYPSTFCSGQLSDTSQ